MRTFLVFGGPPKFWRGCVWWVWLCGTCSGGFPSPFGFDHINRNAPVLIRTPKLTRFEPAQYWGGGPPGNSVVLNPFCFLCVCVCVCVSLCPLLFCLSPPPHILPCVSACPSYTRCSLSLACTGSRFQQKKNSFFPFILAFYGLLVLGRFVSSFFSLVFSALLTECARTRSSSTVFSIFLCFSLPIASFRFFLFFRLLFFSLPSLFSMCVSFFFLFFFF